MKNNLISYFIALTALTTACSPPGATVINNYIAPEKKEAKGASSEVKIRNDKLNKLQNLVSSGRLTLETKKMLKDLIQAEFIQEENLDPEQIKRIALTSEFQAIFSFDNAEINEFKKISDKVIQLRKKRETDFTIMKSVSGGLELVYDAASFGAGISGMGTLAVGAIQAIKVANIKGIEYVVNKIETEMKIKAVEYFQTTVMDVKVNRAKLVELSKLPKAEALQKAELLAEAWTHSLQTPGMNADERRDALSLANHYIAQAALENSISNSVDIHSLKQVNEKTNNELVALSVAMKKFAKQISLRVEEIGQGQIDVTHLIDSYNESLNEQAKNNSETTTVKNGIEFVNSIIQGEVKDPKNSSEKAIVQKQKELLAQIFSYMDSANSFVKLAENLGVEARILNDIKNVNNTYQAGFDIYKNMLSGNYLESAALVTGLFKGSPFSMQDIRHHEVMGRLDLILQMQKSIIENQAIILDGINLILSNQKKQVEVMVKISEQLANSTQLIYGELINVNDKLDYITSGMDSLLLNNLNQCRMMELILNRNGNDILKRFEIVKKPTNEFYNYAINCVNLQAMTYEQNLNLAPFYVRSAYTDDNANAIAAIDSIYRMYYAHSLVAKDIGNFVKAANPVSTAYDLLLKEKINTNADLLSVEEIHKSYDLLKSRINTFVLLKSVKNLIKIHPYITIFRNAPYGEKVDTQQIIELSLLNSDDVARAFDGALRWIRAAIIQESNYYGDSVLTQIYSKYSELSDESVNCLSVSRFDKIQCELKSNKALGKNFAIYALNRMLKENNIHPSAFEIARNLALKRNDVSEIELLNRKAKLLKFKIVDNELHLVISKELSLKVPVREEILSGQFELSPLIGDLLMTQKKLIQLLTEIEMDNHINDTEKLMLFKTL